MNLNHMGHPKYLHKERPDDKVLILIDGTFIPAKLSQIQEYLRVPRKPKPDAEPRKEGK